MINISPQRLFSVEPQQVRDCVHACMRASCFPQIAVDFPTCPLPSFLLKKNNNNRIRNMLRHNGLRRKIGPQRDYHKAKVGQIGVNFRKTGHAHACVHAIRNGHNGNSLR